MNRVLTTDFTDFTDGKTVLSYPWLSVVLYQKTPHFWQNFDRMNRMNRIDFACELDVESLFYPVNPVHPVKMSCLVAAGRAGKSVVNFLSWRKDVPVLCDFATLRLCVKHLSSIFVAGCFLLDAKTQRRKDAKAQSVGQSISDAVALLC